MPQLVASAIRAARGVGGWGPPSGSGLLKLRLHTWRSEHMMVNTRQRKAPFGRAEQSGQCGNVVADKSAVRLRGARAVHSAALSLRRMLIDYRAQFTIRQMFRPSVTGLGQHVLCSLLGFDTRQWPAANASCNLTKHKAEAFPVVKVRRHTDL
jgi:hypothetical protein